MLDLIHYVGPDSEALTTHVRDRFVAALNQHQKHVLEIRVHVQDLNGRRGGASDKRCLAVVRLDGFASNVVLDERGEDLYTVVSLAADRAKQTVGRMLNRRKAS
ncbi:MAG: HPF/RaiA family ribosome-associated protein [Tepidisphaeraceae bacterium]